MILDKSLEMLKLYLKEIYDEIIEIIFNIKSTHLEVNTCEYEQIFSFIMLYITNVCLQSILKQDN